MLHNFKMLNFGVGVFADTQEGEHILSELTKLKYQLKSNEISDRNYFRSLNNLKNKASSFIDWHLHIAEYWDLKGNAKKMFEAAMRGIKIANAIIPNDFKGRIEWGRLENESYLKLRHLVARFYMESGRHQDAVNEIKALLALNPTIDPQQIRYQLGSQAMRASDYVLARDAFKNYPSRRSFYFYEYGLCLLLNGDWKGGVANLRRGFIENHLIAEQIIGYLDGGDDDLKKLTLPDAIIVSMVEDANDYRRLYSPFWRENPIFQKLLGSIFTHSSLKYERFSVMHCRIEMHKENNQIRHEELIDEVHRHISNIENSLCPCLFVE